MSYLSDSSAEEVATAVAARMLRNTCALLLKVSPDLFLCKSNEGDDVIRLPTVISILSNGGIMSREQRLELGKECALACCPLHYCHITVPTFGGPETMRVRKYTASDLSKVVEVCADWLLREHASLVYQ
jgi:hypothetical protein